MELLIPVTFIWQKTEGLADDNKKYINLRAVAFLYKAPAQLVVLKDSGINQVSQLKGKRVAIGEPGSGAVASAERFMKLVGLWNNINKLFLGYTGAAIAMKEGFVDAMWILSGYPTRALIELSATRNIELLHVYTIAAQNGLSKKFPFYKPLFIPPNTYEGVNHATASFFDSALWIANVNVSVDHVYKALKEIYSEEGLKYMVNIKSTAKQMSVTEGVTGIVTPLHKGAERFWKEKKTDHYSCRYSSINNLFRSIPHYAERQRNIRDQALI